MKMAMNANLGDMFTNQMMGAFQKNAEYDLKKPVLGSLIQDRTSHANS